VKRLGVLLLALPALGFSVMRDPSTTAPLAWGSPSVTMVLQQDGASDVSDGTDLDAARMALAAWGQPACTNFSFHDGGLSAMGGASQDGVNRISFVESWTEAAGIVALTKQIRRTDVTPQRFIEADIIVNQQDFTWATNGDLHAYDVQSVLAHELGHVAGLSHSQDLEATMYFAYRTSLTANRTLAADDIAGVCYVYPAATFTCSTDADCPLYFGAYFGGSDVRLRCSAGNCVVGSVGYGQACSADVDCQSGICFKPLDGAPPIEPGFCTQSCTASPSTCPGGDFCAPDVVGVRGNLCYLDRVDCERDSDCASHGSYWYCLRDLDAKYRCRHTCLLDSHCSAISGAICHGAIDAGSPGFCREPGNKADGDDCSNGLECQSLYCSGAGLWPRCGRDPVLPPSDAGPDEPGFDGAPHDEPGSQAGDPGLDDTPGDSTSADVGGPPSDVDIDAIGPTATDQVPPSERQSAELVGGCSCSQRCVPAMWGWLVLFVGLCHPGRRRPRP